MKTYTILVAAATLGLLAGCAASSKTFYANASKIKDTQLCRTMLETYEKEGASQFVVDVAGEVEKRNLTLEECRTKVATENAVIIGAVVVATGVGVGIACKDGCAMPSGGYRPSYASVGDDIDCLGGTGNGPRFTTVYGPFQIDPYNDPHNLDADNDGWACEAGEGGWGT